MVRFRTDGAEQPQVSQTVERVLQPGRRRKSSRYSRMNDRLGVFLVLLVVLAAIPVASNRPVWWLIWGALIGTAAILYAALGLRFQGGGRRPLQVSVYRWPSILALMVPIYALVQAVPLAGWLPQGLLALPPILAGLEVPTISALPGASVLGALRSTVYLLFLGLVIEAATQEDRIRRLSALLFAGLALHAAWGIVALQVLDDFALWGEKTAYLGSLTGTFVNRNSFATFIGFGLILGLAIALERGERLKNEQAGNSRGRFLIGEWLEVAVLWLVLAMILAALLMTQSRLGILSVVAGGVAMLMALRVTGRVSPLRLIVEMAVVVVGLVAAALALGARGIVERTLFVGVDSGIRADIYATVLDMIRMRPLTGFGSDAFAIAFDMFRAPPILAAVEYDLAHNTYLALWSESGLIVGSIPIVLTLLAAAAIVRKLHRGEGVRMINLAAIGVIVQGGVHSLGDFSLEVPANVLVFLLIVGLALGHPRLDRVPAAPARVVGEPAGDRA